MVPVVVEGIEQKLGVHSEAEQMGRLVVRKLDSERVYFVLSFLSRHSVCDEIRLLASMSLVRPFVSPEPNLSTSEPDC